MVGNYSIYVLYSELLGGGFTQDFPDFDLFAWKQNCNVEYVLYLSLQNISVQWEHGNIKYGLHMQYRIPDSLQAP